MCRCHAQRQIAVACVRLSKVERPIPLMSCMRISPCNYTGQPPLTLRMRISPCNYTGQPRSHREQDCSFEAEIHSKKNKLGRK